MHPHCLRPPEIIGVRNHYHPRLPPGQVAVDHRPFRVGMVGGIAREAVAGEEFGEAQEIGGILRIPVLTPPDTEAAVEVFVQEECVFGDVGLFAADVEHEDVVAVVYADRQFFVQNGSKMLACVIKPGFEAGKSLLLHYFEQFLVHHRRQAFVRIPEVGETVAKGRVGPCGKKAVLVRISRGEAIGHHLARRAVERVEETATGIVVGEAVGQLGRDPVVQHRLIAVVNAEIIVGLFKAEIPLIPFLHFPFTILGGAAGCKEED